MVWWTDQRFQELTGFDSETTQNVKNACNQQFANNLPQLDGASLRLKESQAIVTQCISTALQLSLAPHQQAVPSAAKKHLRMLATMWVRDDKRAKQRTREQSLPETADLPTPSPSQERIPRKRQRRDSAARTMHRKSIEIPGSPLPAIESPILGGYGSLDPALFVAGPLFPSSPSQDSQASSVPASPLHLRARRQSVEPSSSTQAAEALLTLNSAGFAPTRSSRVEDTIIVSRSTTYRRHGRHIPQGENMKTSPSNASITSLKRTNIIRGGPLRRTTSCSSAGAEAKRSSAANDMQPEQSTRTDGFSCSAAPALADTLILENPSPPNSKGTDSGIESSSNITPTRFNTDLYSHKTIHPDTNPSTYFLAGAVNEVNSSPALAFLAPYKFRQSGSSELSLRKVQYLRGRRRESQLFGRVND